MCCAFQFFLMVWCQPASLMRLTFTSAALKFFALVQAPLSHFCVPQSLQIKSGDSLWMMMWKKKSVELLKFCESWGSHQVRRAACVWSGRKRSNSCKCAQHNDLNCVKTESFFFPVDMFDFSRGFKTNRWAAEPTAHAHVIWPLFASDFIESSLESSWISVVQTVHKGGKNPR